MYGILRPRSTQIADEDLNVFLMIDAGNGTRHLDA